MNMESKFEYLAFISYKREDEKWAGWLQRKIEGYRLPARICKTHNLPPKLPRVFRDTTDIAPGPLTDTLQKSLDSSKYLIVVCSPLSARSFWVGEEIKHFIGSGRQHQILLFIVSGIPYSGNPETECIHPVVRKQLPEMLGVNIHEEGSELKYIKEQKAFIKLLSTILELSFDALWNRYRRRIIKKAVTYILFLLLFITTLGFVWNVNQPFDMKVLTKEISLRNPHLPFPQSGGFCILKLDNQTFTDTLFSFFDTVVFRNIPAKYKNKFISLSFSAEGFYLTDTAITPGQKRIINIKRDDTYYGMVQGIIRNQQDDRVPNAIVNILNHSVKTNEMGEFLLFIPLIEQDTAYWADIISKNLKFMDNKVYPMQHNDLINNAIYLK